MRKIHGVTAFFACLLGPPCYPEHGQGQRRSRRQASEKKELGPVHFPLDRAGGGGLALEQKGRLEAAENRQKGESSADPNHTGIRIGNADHCRQRRNPTRKTGSAKGNLQHWFRLLRGSDNREQADALPRCPPREVKDRRQKRCQVEECVSGGAWHFGGARAILREVESSETKAGCGGAHNR